MAGGPLNLVRSPLRVVASPARFTGSLLYLYQFDTELDTVHDIRILQSSALNWWLHDDQRQQWPKLSQMAIDIFSIAGFQL